MYIQSQRMELQAWTPNFNPNEDNPIILVWIFIPELPWHFYYMEVLFLLSSPIGKVLHLDLDLIQKTRGSVAKVKMQVYLTQLRPHHVWLGFDEDQDVNEDGQWLEVVYEDIPTYCSHQCFKKRRSDRFKREATQSDGCSLFHA